MPILEKKIKEETEQKKTHTPNLLVSGKEALALALALAPCTEMAPLQRTFPTANKIHTNTYVQQQQQQHALLASRTVPLTE
jgi:hypothetical protein